MANKQRTIFYYRVVLAILLISVTNEACKKEDQRNKPPTCTITYPDNLQQIVKGEITTITIDASDNDGVVNQVDFYIDNFRKDSATSIPFSYKWFTSIEDTGNHILKAIAIDNMGKSASAEISVSLESNIGYFFDPRNGQTYKTVKIGNQTWFAENLNYVTENSWWYNNSQTNGAIYGRLYKWDEALTVCPNGWRLPSDADWKNLEIQIGMSLAETEKNGPRGTDEGIKLKYTNGWKNNASGDNSTGFSALASGFKNLEGDFNQLGYVESWWSSDKYDSTYSWIRLLSCWNTEKVVRTGLKKECGASIRCVKD